MEQLVADLGANKVGGLLIYGVNPAYSYYNKEKFIAGLKNTVAVSSMQQWTKPQSNVNMLFLLTTG
ncbi:MAG: hypothetical protein WDM90_04910 [Ferruginibacter sp.]